MDTLVRAPGTTTNATVPVPERVAAAAAPGEEEGTHPPNNEVPCDEQEKVTSPDAPPAERNRAPGEEAGRLPWSNKETRGPRRGGAPSGLRWRPRMQRLKDKGSCGLPPTQRRKRTADCGRHDASPRHGKGPKVVRELLRRDNGVDSTGAEGITPLHQTRGVRSLAVSNKGRMEVCCSSL